MRVNTLLVPHQWLPPEWSPTGGLLPRDPSRAQPPGLATPRRQRGRHALTGLTAIAAATWLWAIAQAAQAAQPQPQPVTPTASESAPSPLMMHAGSSRVLPLSQAAERVAVAHPGVVDVTLIGGRELYLLARGIGTTTILVWPRGGALMVMDVQVAMDVGPLERQLAQLLPTERGIRVQAAADSVALTGEVSSLLKAEQAVALAAGHVRALARQAQPIPMPSAPPGGGTGTGAAGTPGGAATNLAALRGPNLGAGAPTPHVINLLTVRQPQQVMLEVKVAEVSRNLLDQLGVSLNLSRVSGSMTYGLVTRSLQDVFGQLILAGKDGRATVDAKSQDALVRILAEPNIVALSGQEGSFLAGGKVFIPVARDALEGRATITLEEKEFGVGLRFTPQVLEHDVVQLKVAPEVSELAKTGSPFLTTGGVTTVLPSFTTRRASTTVQLRDGQSLAIAGLIKNNITESLNKFPFLAEIPILGALFRSTEFQTDRTELLFVITPRLVRALPPAAALPTDAHEPPGRAEALLQGRLERGREGTDAASGQSVRDARAAQTMRPQREVDPTLPDARPARSMGSSGTGGGAAGTPRRPSSFDEPMGDGAAEGQR